MAAGSIVVDLLMRTGSFESDTERARKTLDKKMAEMKKSAIDAGKAIGQAIAGFATGVTILVQQTAKANDELRRFAQLSNTSMQSFQVMAAGAKMVGIEHDKLADIFKDVQDKVGDFMQTGGGPLADFFENIAPKVGVTADQFRRLSGPEALQLYVSSLEKANLSQSDIIFYLEAIASDASLLLPLLQQGGKGFEQYGEMARQFGVILSDEAMVAMQDFKQSQAMLELGMKGFANQLTIELVPAFQNLVKMFANTETGAKKLNSAVQIVAAGMKILMSAGAIVAGLFKTIGQALGGIAAIAVNVFAGRFSQAFDIAKSASWDFVDNLKESVNAAKAVWADYQPGAGGAMPDIPVLGGTLSARNTKKEKTPKDPYFNDWMKELQAVEDLRAAEIQMKIETNEALKKEDQAYDDWMNELRQAELDRYGDMLDKRLEEDRKAAEKTKEMSRQLGMTFTSAFEDAIVEGKKLSDVLRGLAQDILRITTRKMVTEPLGNVLTSAIGEMFGGARAGGGDVIGGRSYLVGENGPEMFTPRTTGTITPSGSTSGATIVQNINVTTGVQQTVRAEIISLMPQIAGAAKAAVADAKLRGGSYAAALR